MLIFILKVVKQLELLVVPEVLKCSLVNLISRLYDVDEGSVVVGGQDVRNYDLEVLRDEVSVVLQRMFYLVEQSYKIYVGVMKMQQKKNVKKLVV